MEKIYEQANSDHSKLYKEFFACDDKAVRTIVGLYRDGIILFVNGIVRNFTVAEDIACEVFAKLIAKKPKIKNDAYFKTYVFAMARNQAYDYVKKNKNLVSLADATLMEGTDPYDILCENERRVAIVRAMDELNEDYRSVLFLSYYEDMSVEEICRAMKKNKKQVYNLLDRARSALKTILEKEGIAYEND